MCNHVAPYGRDLGEAKTRMNRKAGYSMFIYLQGKKSMRGVRHRATRGYEIKTAKPAPGDRGTGFMASPNDFGQRTPNAQAKLGEPAWYKNSARRNQVGGRSA